MRGRLQTTAALLRTRALGPVVVLAAVALLVLGIRKLAGGPDRPPPRKAAPIFRAQLQRDPPPPRPAPPPPPVTPPKLEEPQTTRVEFKANEIPPPDAPPPAPAAGPLALAEAGSGPGDAFNLAGNPGGRGLLSGGGLGDGTGAGGLGGDQDPRARFGWYYGKIASALEASLRGNKLVSSASTRVEVRVWADASGRVSRVQLVRSTGDPRLDEAIQSTAGLMVSAPPGDIPMPMVLRITARRPG